MSEAAADDDVLADLVGRVADEFTEALKRGEQPDVEAYASQHPEIAAVLREVLPTLQVMRLPASAAFPAVTPVSGLPLPYVLGDYRLLREIGRGGMGIVYEAQQISLKRPVALKVLPVHPALEAKYLARFEREAKTAAALHHTNIVPVFAVGHEQNVHFYAMQLIDGRGLDQILISMRGRLASPADRTRVQEQQVKELPDPLCATAIKPASAESSRTGVPSSGYFLAVARMGLQVAEALEYAHQRGVVHRDVKPSNLILDNSGIVWITDFGLVKHLDGADGDNLTGTGDVLGTARYMSPEQALPSRGSVDSRSDIYSLGVTLYELLTLTPAFESADQAALLQQIAYEEPATPRQRHRAVPRDLETIVLRAMAKDPRQRYRSAAALAADLRRFIAGEPIQARSLGTLERLWKWSRRRPAVAALLMVIVLAIVSLVAGALWSNAQLRQANEREQQRAREAEERERIGRRHLYAAYLSLAQQAWERGHMARVHTLLEQSIPQRGRDDEPEPEDLCGFEWHYLWRQSHREQFSWRAHSHTVTALVFDPRGRFLLSGSYDRSIRLSEPTTGKLLKSLSGNREGVTALAISRNGALVASASQDQTIRLFDTESGKGRELGRHSGPAQAVALSPDGKWLASGGADGSVRLWDLAVEKEARVFHGHGGAVLAVAFSPDSETIASGGADRTVRLWPLVRDGESKVLEGHTHEVRSLAFAPDGKLLASGSADYTVKLWDVTALKESATLRGHADPVNVVRFSSDGQTLASGDGEASLQPQQPAKSPATQLRARPGEIKLWDVPTARERASLRGHAGPVFAVAFSQDGKTLASGGEEKSIIIWSIAGVERRINLPGHAKEVNSVAFAPDGRTLLTASDDQTARLWDVSEGRELASIQDHNGPIKAVAFATDGRRFATGAGDKLIKLWDTKTRRVLATLQDHRATMRAVVFSPDGKTLASTAGEIERKAQPGEVKLWDLETFRERANLKGHGNCVRSAAFSPNGALLATGSDDKTVKLWDVASGRCLRTIEQLPYEARSVAFSPDGAVLAIACGGVWDAHLPGVIQLWDIKEQKVRAVLRGHRAGVMVVAFAPDGRSLASSSTDGSIKLWDPVTGQERAILEGHQGLIRTLAFARDGHVLATGDSDGLVKLWFGAGK